MANLKEVRNRIASVTSTQQITSAMKMVSAAKLRRAQDAIIRMRPYANKLKEVLSNLSATLESSSDNVYAKEREVKSVLFVVITSNRGLCGAFNSNVIKLALRTIHSKYEKQLQAGNVRFVTVGRKSTEYFKRNNYTIENSYIEIFNALNFENTAPIAESIMSGFVAGKYDKVELVYNQFKNAAVQYAIDEQFLPVLPPQIAEGTKKVQADYIFEPSKADIVTELIPKSLKIQLYKALLDSHASEHGARMTAMNKATDNAKDMIKELKLSYNKARQATITKEILEIVSGAEALNN